MKTLLQIILGLTLVTSAAADDPPEYLNDKRSLRDAIQYDAPLPPYQQNEWRLPLLGFDTWSSYEAAFPSSAYSNIVERWVTNLANTIYTQGIARAIGAAIYIDDGWEQLRRTASGDLTWNTNIFPIGMPALIAACHAKGVKVILYSALGTNTCGGYPGSPLNKIYRDVQVMMDWGADGCFFDTCDNWIAENERERTAIIRLANRAVRDYHAMVYSTQGTPRPFYISTTTGNGAATLGRQVIVSDTVSAVNSLAWNWGYQGETFAQNVEKSKESLRYLGNWIRPGFFPDARRLYPGQYNPVYYWTHGYNLALMAMSCEQLRTGAGDRRVGTWTNAAYGGGGADTAGYSWHEMTNVWARHLTNPDLINIWHDPLVSPAKIIKTNDASELWVKRLVDPNKKALLLLNLASTNYTMTVNASDFGGVTGREYRLYNVLSNFTELQFSDSFTYTISNNTCALFSVGPATPEEQYSWNTVAITGTGASRASTSSQLPSPWFANDGINQTAANQYFFFNVPAPWWATRATVRLRMAAAANMAFTNGLAYYHYHPTGRITHNSTSTPSDGSPLISDVTVNLTSGTAQWITNTIPMLKTNSPKELVITVNASTNNSARYVVGPIYVTWD